MPSCLTGGDKLKWRYDVLAMVKGLDGTEEMLKASKDGEQNWFQVTDHGDNNFTIHVGHAWNSFTIDKEFEHDFQGGASGVKGKCT